MYFYNYYRYLVSVDLNHTLGSSFVPRNYDRQGREDR